MFSKNSYIEIRIPKVVVLGGEDLGRQLDHEDEALINEINVISDLIKEALETPFPFHHVRTQWEGIIYEPKSRSSSDTKSTSDLILDFPVSSTVIDKFMLFVSYIVYCLFL